MASYSYSVASATPSVTVTTLTGGGGQPANRQGTLRSIRSINNGLSVPVTLKFYDTTAALTTAVGAYVDYTQVAADAYGKFAYGVSGDLDASGTPTLDGDATFTPPTSAPTGTGLPDDSSAEAQDYRSSTGVYTLHKYPGLKNVATTVNADGATALRPIATVIVPANSIEYGIEFPIQYISGLGVTSDNTSAVAIVLDID